MKHHTTFLALAAFLLILAGCQDSQSMTEDPAIVPAGLSIPVHLSSPEAMSDTPVTRAMRGERARQTMETRYLFSELVSTSEDWNTAHESVVKELELDSDVPHHKREQIAALFMLQIHLNDPELPAEAMDAVSYYTKLLVDNHSPEGNVIAESLTRLRTTWSEEELSNAAQTAKAGIEKFLEKRYDCVDCSVAGGGSKMSKNAQNQIDTSNDIFFAQTVASLSVLDSLIK